MNLFMLGFYLVDKYQLVYILVMNKEVDILITNSLFLIGCIYIQDNKFELEMLTL